MRRTVRHDTSARLHVRHTRATVGGDLDARELSPVPCRVFAPVQQEKSRRLSAIFTHPL